mmetsp:Transcript_63352/g.113018  ORF Transcript_63352/g.113018 Transcript_63352/m.113018 type:complete len:81 (+) Transcript_63352:1301-1543(+)
MTPVEIKLISDQRESSVAKRPIWGSGDPSEAQTGLYPLPNAVPTILGAGKQHADKQITAQEEIRGDGQLKSSLHIWQHVV